MKPNRDISLSKKGMVKDTHPSNLSEQQYVHAENALIEGQAGDAFNLQNEDSNILCSRLLAGFYVIGFERDITSDRTYLFLTNPTTGDSEIGYILEQEIQATFQDTIENSSCDCDSSLVLAQGLENIDEISTCTYTTLVTDYNCSDFGVGSFDFTISPSFNVTPEEVNVISSGSVDNSGASGTGVAFEVVTAASGTEIFSITVTSQGSGYQVGDVIVIRGNELNGGSTPDDDITITLTANRCLNFDKNYPVSSQLKDEKCGKVLYFTDDLNRRRRLELDRLDQYFTRTVECEDSDEDCDCGTKQVSVCMNCDRLEVLPQNEPFCFDVSTVNGGNLRHGKYFFFGGYCDSQGNLMSNILTQTGGVSINNKNKTIYQQPELDERTNLGIKIDVSNLDLAFDYYKVIVLQRSSVDGADSYFTVGVYPTSTETITFTNENDLARSSVQEVTNFLPDYTKAKSVEQTNNTLFYSDLEARPDPNLQPVVNFMGQFAKWRTVTGNEDLYADGRGTAMFLGYMRDEVVPFSIRFKTNTGYVTPNYPLIARHVESADPSVNGGIINLGKEDVLFDEQGGDTDDLSTQINLITAFLDDDNPDPESWQMDVYSILDTSSSFCTPSDRNQKWQFYNTGCPATTSTNLVFGNFAAADANRSQGFYPAVTPTSSGAGTGLIVDVRVDANGKVDYIVVVNQGTGHLVGDTFTITDSLLGNGGAVDYTFSLVKIEAATKDLWENCSTGEIKTEYKSVTRACVTTSQVTLPDLPQSFPLVIEDVEEGVNNFADYLEDAYENGTLEDGLITGLTQTSPLPVSTVIGTANAVIIATASDISTSGSGSGFAATITLDATGANPSLSVDSSGQDYQAGDTITFPAANFTDLTTDLVYEIDSVANLLERVSSLEDDDPECSLCTPEDLFPDCDTPNFISREFNILNLIPSSSGETYNIDILYKECTRDGDDKNVFYPRIPTPSSCNIFNIAIDSNGKSTGNDLNGESDDPTTGDGGNYNYWLKRTADTGGGLPDNSTCEDCWNVGCSPSTKTPSYFERISNFLGNTSKASSLNVTPSTYDLNTYSFNIIPFFNENTSDDLCDSDASLQDEAPFGTSVPAIALTNAEFITETNAGSKEDTVITYVGNNFSSVQAPSSVCGENCGYDEGKVEASFLNSVHKNAIWYNVTNVDSDFVVLNFSNLVDPAVNFRDCLTYSRYLRLTVIDQSNNKLEVNGDPNTTSTQVVLIDLYDDELYDGVYCVNTEGLSEFYFAVDAPVITITDTTDCHEGNKYLTGTQNCLDVGIFRPTIDKLVVYNNEGITFNLRGQNICSYEAECLLPIDEYLSCDPYLQDEGCFAYWQSSENYPDNNQLWNSKKEIVSVDPTSLPSTIRDEFKRIYLDASNNLTDEADFSCKPIRHFKFPDFNIAPTFNTDTVEAQTNKIQPIGFWLDNDVIEAFLDLAVTKNLITQEFRDSITHYELFRGDIKLNKSIVAKGLTYDMYSYTETQNEQKTNWFSNFPYNDLSENQLIYADENRNDFIQHPNDDKSNSRFTFHSPETHFEKPNLGFEYYFESYFKGYSRGMYSEVNSHPTMTILTQKAFSLATLLATTEVILDIVTNTASFIKELSVGLSTNVGAAVAVGLYTASAFANAFSQGRAKKQEWLNIFYNNANPSNFAHYYSSVGLYNDFQAFANPEGNKLRGLSERLYLKDGIYRINERGASLPTVINNKQRESSVYLHMQQPLAVDSAISSYDTSRLDASSYGCETIERSSTPEYKNFISSPYVSIKNYVPAQYGTINSINWIHTGYCGVLADDNSCDVTFGGDTYISRFSLKRKYPFFLNAMIDGNSRLPDLTPFIYSRQRNVGYPVYFIDYLSKEEDAGNIFGISMRSPVASTEYNLDCLDTTNDSGNAAMSVQSGSKFYLYYYGIPSFLVESRVNLNFRYGENETNKDFYPNQQDYVEWTQEKNVSIREDNYFFYNNLYSSENSLSNYRVLPDNYDEEEWNCRFDHWDRTIYSLPDNNEQDLSDNFRVFKANNYNDFGNQYGTFYGLKALENQKVLGRFENGMVVFNAFNTIEGSTENIAVGTGNIFQNRPTDFYQTELGYGGTQHRAFVSCEFGHFWTDAKRGRFFHLQPNGGGLKEVSRNGMKNWFRENLPFRIKKDFPDIPADMLDNTYDGLGITMVWDDRNSRVIITKKDVILKSTAPNELSITGLDFTYLDQDDNTVVVDVTDTDYFEDCSWTVSYSPLIEGFVSFHSYKPNYYIPYQNYFSSGVNVGANAGLWNHLLGSNQTFQVYYGTRYPWIIEYPVKKNFMTKMLEDVSYRLDVRRYTNEYDYGYQDGNFDSAVIYNDRESTGLLNLVKANPSDQRQAINYPLHNATSIDIVSTLEDYTWSFNYIMDNVKDSHNLPLWINSASNVEKSVNTPAFDYRPVFKNHLRGQWFIVRLSQGSESRFKFIFEHAITEEKEYDAY